MQKHTNRRQHHSNPMNLSKGMSKSAKPTAILEKVVAIFDFQMFIYLDLTNTSKYVCANYHVSAAIINYLDK